MQIMYSPPTIMMAIATNLAAVKTFCTLVASWTLKQLIKVIKPANGKKRKKNQVNHNGKTETF